MKIESQQQRPDEAKEAETKFSPLSVYKDYLNDPNTKECLRISNEYSELRRQIRQRYDDLDKTKNTISSGKYEMEKNKLIRWQQEEQKKFNEEIGRPIEQVWEQDRKTEEKYFGFDDGAVAGTLEAFNKFCLEHYGRIHSEKWDYGATKYLSLMSVILKIYGQNLNGVTIVEIGPGSEGKTVLEFLQHLGAKAIGLDNNKSTEAKGVVQYGEWSKLSKSIEHDSADVIFTHNMTPLASSGTEFEFDSEAFEKRCAEELHKCLKHNGVLIEHMIDADRGLQNPGHYGLGKYIPIGFSSNKQGPHYKGSMNLFIRTE